MLLPLLLGFASHIHAQIPGKLISDAIESKEWVQCIAFTPNGELLAVGGGRERTGKHRPVAELTLWDVKTQKTNRKLVGHTDPVACVAFSPDGKILASGSSDRTVRLWETATGKELAVLKDSPHAVIAIAFDPAGATLAGIVSTIGNGPDFSAPGVVFLWDIPTRKVRAKLEDHSGPVRGIAFSPDGKTLAAAGGRWDKDREKFTHGEVSSGIRRTGNSRTHSRATATRFGRLRTARMGRLLRLVRQSHPMTL